MLVCYAIILMINNTRQGCFFFVERKLECTRIHGPSETVEQFYAAPHSQVHKKV